MLRMALKTCFGSVSLLSYCQQPGRKREQLQAAKLLQPTSSPLQCDCYDFAAEWDGTACAGISIMAPAANGGGWMRMQLSGIAAHRIAVGADTPNATVAKVFAVHPSGVLLLKRWLACGTFRKVQTAGLYCSFFSTIDAVQQSPSSPHYVFSPCLQLFFSAAFGPSISFGSKACALAPLSTRSSGIRAVRCACPASFSPRARRR